MWIVCGVQSVHAGATSGGYIWSTLYINQNDTKGIFSVAWTHALGVTGVAGLVSMSKPPLPMDSLAKDSFSTCSHVSMVADGKKVLTIVLVTSV